MEELYQALFHYYAEERMGELGYGFNGVALQRDLEKYLLNPQASAPIESLLFDHYTRWASAAFYIGLHLGLTLTQ